MNRTYINFAYKFINELGYLLVLEAPFRKLFTTYVEIPILEQIYTLLVKEVNSLYECFKHSIECYFTWFDR